MIYIQESPWQRSAPHFLTCTVVSGRKKVQRNMSLALNRIQKSEALRQREFPLAGLRSRFWPTSKSEKFQCEFDQDTEELHRGSLTGQLNFVATCNKCCYFHVSLRYMFQPFFKRPLEQLQFGLQVLLLLKCSSVLLDGLQNLVTRVMYNLQSWFCRYVAALDVSQQRVTGVVSKT